MHDPRRGVAPTTAALAVAVVMMLSVLSFAPAPGAAVASSLPSSELRSPAITSSAPGRIDVFWRSDAGDLIHQYRPAGGWWTRPINLGGDLASQPAAVSWGPGRIDVFARRSDGRLVHRWLRDGTWAAWRGRGGRLTSAPAAASQQPGRLDVVARGFDGALIHRSLVQGSGWSAWHDRGGTLTSSPAAASWGPGRLDVVARGPGNQLLHRYRTSRRGWSPWRSRGRGLRSQPAIAAPGAGLLDVVVLGADQSIRHRRHIAGDGWSGWTTRGGDVTSGPTATAVGTEVRIAARRSGGRAVESVRTRPSGSWSGWRGIDHLRPFRRLGTWVDVFDYDLDPAASVADMAARGVHTLYLSTARFTTPTDFHDVTLAGRWLDAAHAAGLQVVGWYAPAYGDMPRDVRRTVAIARFVSPGRQRFDAVGVDIERLDEVTRAQFNVRLVRHLDRVRSRTDAVVTSIVPSPFATEPGNNWEGFPWASVGARSDVVIPMALWSFRDGCDGPATCPMSPAQVYAWVLDQARRTRTLTRRPVHVEGGVDDPGNERTPVTPARVERFVGAVRDSGAVGGSHYDYATTDDALWPPLAGLNG